VSLCYQPAASRITVVVLKARNLPKMDITGLSGTTRNFSGEFQPTSQVRQEISHGSYNRPLRYDKKLLMGVITGLSATTRNFSWEF
jgi:hypothetical protein